MKNEENFSVHLNNKVYLLTSRSYFTKHEVTACTVFVYYVYIFIMFKYLRKICYLDMLNIFSYHIIYIHTYTHIYIYIFFKYIMCVCICVYIY